ncbi:hypothetical protein Hanom_Chr02g00133141 [Helianthus anomalus]
MILFFKYSLSIAILNVDTIDNSTAIPPQHAENLTSSSIFFSFILIICNFFERSTNSPNELLAKFTTSGYTRRLTGESPLLGPKPVNTHLKAQHCSEVKPAQIKDRISDLCLVCHHQQVL